MMNRVLLVALALVAITVVDAAQKYTVKGQLTCGGKPATNVKVWLVDKDTGCE